jgi:hypothetical protein
MAYIVTAKVRSELETNAGGIIEKVNAQTMSDPNGYLTFWVKGRFGAEKEIVGDLVKSLLDAGFYEFNIEHSY